MGGLMCRADRYPTQHKGGVSAVRLVGRALRVLLLLYVCILIGNIQRGDGQGNITSNGGNDSQPAMVAMAQNNRPMTRIGISVALPAGAIASNVTSHSRKPARKIQIHGIERGEWPAKARQSKAKEAVGTTRHFLLSQERQLQTAQ